MTGPVVGQSHHPGPLEFPQLGHLLALAPLRDAADGIHPAKAFLGGFRLDEMHDGLVVDGRVGVGHAGHRRDPPGHRRVGARDDGLFVLIPRLAQVHMHIHEARRDRQALGVEDLVGLDLEALAHLGDDAVLDEDIGLAVPLVDGIDDVAALDQYATHRAPNLSHAVNAAPQHKLGVRSEELEVDGI
jgi:hypothetical protein